MKRLVFFFFLLIISIGIVKADEWCYLDSLSIKNVDYDIGFNSKKYDYYLPVPLDVSSLNLDYTYTTDCKIEVEGNENLKEGDNKVLIKLTKGNYETTYRITVNKHYMDNGKKEEQEKFPIVYVGFIFGVAAIVIGIISIVLSKIKSKAKV